eukprot:2797526-Pleurochrysis_carterae.AAC.1
MRTHPRRSACSSDQACSPPHACAHAHTFVHGSAQACAHAHARARSNVRNRLFYHESASIDEALEHFTRQAPNCQNGKTAAGLLRAFTVDALLLSHRRRRS